MSFTAFTDDEIAPGQPVKTDLWVKAQQDLNDHESRLETLEASFNTYVPIEFVVLGAYDLIVPITQAMVERLTFNITIQNARLFVVDAGSAGTLQCDIQYKRGIGSWTSIFSTKPALDYLAGNLALSTNQVLSTTALLAGDLIRLNIETGQTGNTEFHAIIEFRAT